MYDSSRPHRSGGSRGATLQNLRGTSGADFEGKVDIERGRIPTCCSVYGGRLDKNVIALIKGPFLFIFKTESDKSPKYAVSLINLEALLESSSGKVHPVSLQTSLGDIEYEIAFDSAETASRFVMVANEQARGGQADQVRKRLGHEKLLSKKASIRFAEQVAIERAKQQPEKPITTGELMKEIVANPISTPM